MDNLDFALAMVLLVTTFAAVGSMVVSHIERGDGWVSGIAKAAAIFAVSIITALFLFGCSYPPASQPRALGVGNMQPTCLFFCFQTNTQTDAESGATQSTNSTSSQSADVGVGVKP